MSTMSTTTQRRAHVLEATQRAVERVIDLVRSAPDRNVRVPDSPEWTVADTFAHVVTVAPRYAKGPRQQGRWVADPRDLSDLNADEMRELGTSDPAALATALRSTTAALGEQIEGYGETQPVFRFHGGSMISADTALGILLGELLVHGRDMAKALRRPWPIDPRQAAMVIEGVTPILPGWVDHNRARGLTATFEIAPNAGTRHLWSFTDGALTIDPVPRPRVDVHITGDATALLLVLYRREPQWKAVATGRLLAWGRRPWLAFTLTSRFLKP
jgi:uncharacterized protein (TIGR03083 family)